MRKKSHVSLASQVMKGLEVGDYITHRYSFYVGSILPDCVPSFLTTPHSFAGTFLDVQKRIGKFIDQYQKKEVLGKKMTAQLGEIIHYIADYFTFPHNSHYPGSLKDHCKYEKELKYELREYINSGKAMEQNRYIEVQKSKELLCKRILQYHQDYCRYTSNVVTDAHIIVRVCLEVIASLVYLTTGNANVVLQAA